MISMEAMWLTFMVRCLLIFSVICGAGEQILHFLSFIFSECLPSQMYTFSPKGSGTTSTSFLSHSLGSDLLTFVFAFFVCPYLLSDMCGKYSFTTSASRVYILIKRFWNNLYQFVEPFSGKPAIDPTEAMKKQNYTIRKMFQVQFELKLIWKTKDWFSADGGRFLCSDGLVQGAGLFLETLDAGETRG